MLNYHQFERRDRFSVQAGDIILWGIEPYLIRYAGVDDAVIVKVFPHCTDGKMRIVSYSDMAMLPPLLLEMWRTMPETQDKYTVDIPKEVIEDYNIPF